MKRDAELLATERAHVARYLRGIAGKLRQDAESRAAATRWSEAAPDYWDPRPDELEQAAKDIMDGKHVR